MCVYTHTHTHIYMYYKHTNCVCIYIHRYGNSYSNYKVVSISKSTNTLQLWVNNSADCALKPWYGN